MLEDFTGTWCQFCPNGTRGIENLMIQYPTNFIPVSSHNANGDPLEVAETPSVIAGLGGASYPNGAIDRKFFSGTKVPLGIDSKATQWKSAVGAQIASTAVVSVSFSNMQENTDGSYSAKVRVKFTSAPGKSGVPIAVNVLILEDSIKAEGTLAQANGGSAPATPHYGTDRPLTTTKNKYWHNHNVRKYVGGTWGWTDVIPAQGPVVDNEYVKDFSFTVPTTGTIPGPNGWAKKQVHLVAYVAYNGSDHMADQKMILNAEEISLNAFFKVGVNEIKSDVQILNAHPNPAGLNDIMKVEYNIANNETVTMKVYNMVGQHVATPWVSNEVKGSHTIQWRAADHNLTPGLYLIEVSSPSGKQVQRVNIR